MMWTYTLLNLLFIIPVVVLFYFWRRGIAKKPFLKTLIVLFVLTAFFDSLIIWAQIVDYDVSKLLGIYIWKAPLEDFAYTILAVLLIPVLWERLSKHE